MLKSTKDLQPDSAKQRLSVAALPAFKGFSELVARPREKSRLRGCPAVKVVP